VAASRTANPIADCLIGMGPATFQIAYSHSDRVSCQARGAGDCRDAAPTQCHRFSGGPLPTHPLVHHWGQSEEFLPDPFYRGCILHARKMRN